MCWQDPAGFEDETLADPLEGPEYGTCKARIMRRADGSPWLHSFAHGRTVYELKHGARSITASLMAASVDGLAELFVNFVLAGDLDEDEVERLRDIVINRTGIGKRALNAKLKRAQQEHAARLAHEGRERRLAQRTDPRPRLIAPLRDAECLPILTAIDDVLAGLQQSEPPMRDAEGCPTEVRNRSAITLYALLETEINTTKSTRLPAPEMPLLTRHDDYSMAHLIERHIEFYGRDAKGDERTVALNPFYVRHYMKYRESRLPVVTAIVTSPLVLPDGTLLATQGLDCERGIIFRLQPELIAPLPTTEECTLSAVTTAMHFLAGQWLCDVATDYAGKCIIIAAALTILERVLLPERPAIFVTAGQRGGGKTTTLQMLLLAATGYHAAAAAWSTSEEERRKALNFIPQRWGCRGCLGQHPAGRADIMPFDRKVLDGIVL